MSASASASSSSVAETRVSRILSQLEANTVANNSGEKKGPVNIIARQNGVAVIQIAFPPVNSFHPSVQQGIEKAWKEAIADCNTLTTLLCQTSAHVN